MKYDFPIIIPTIICRICNGWAKFASGIRARWLACLWGMKIGRGVRFEGTTLVRTRRNGSITIGRCVVFNANNNTNPVGLSRPTILDTAQGGAISIGEFCGLSGVVISSKSSVTIGRHVKVGGDTRILDHDFHSISPEIRRSPKDCLESRTKPIVIEDDVFIGAGAIICKGVHIGARSIVAAGSVVFSMDIPPDSMVKGNPAIIVIKR